MNFTLLLSDKKTIFVHGCIFSNDLLILLVILIRTNFQLFLSKIDAKFLKQSRIKLSRKKDAYRKGILMARHQKTAKLFDEDFWDTQ